MSKKSLILIILAVVVLVYFIYRLNFVYRGWEEYAVSQYGFSLKIPSDSTVTLLEWETDRSIPLLNFNAHPLEQKYLDQVEKQGWARELHIVIIKNQKVISLDDFLDGKSDDGENYKKEYATIKTFKVNGADAAELSNPKDRSPLVIFSKGDEFVKIGETITVQGANPNLSVNQVIDQIIPTFRFLK